MDYSVDQLVALLQPRAVRGNFFGKIRGIASLEQAKEGDLSFLDNPRYVAHVANSQASVLLLPESYDGKPQPNAAHLIVANPSLALGQLCKEVERERSRPAVAGIHPTALVDATASVHATASIGPYCVVEADVLIAAHAVVLAHCTVGPRCRVGESSLLHPKVCLYQDTEIGAGCIIHGGAVIGCDGYGYATTENGMHHKLAHIGRVVLEDGVEVGANCTIDRARFAETRIGAGTKIDNLVQIGHNVMVGKSCLIVAQVGIAGSTRLGDGVVLAGQVGVAGHISIGAGSQVAAQGGVASNLPPNSIVRGTPAMPLALANRYFVLRKRIPELFRRVENLEREMASDGH
ncbi:MAG: UDP-3-O-(3-hydroxymyristoyl)glucosamine N-acyltransferase [Puniceicoccales bacterium]|jgi:UDP-3-O-[3-hydroxymyristoyl] glucosamine N-acyltransferase|nr:UDP-3-O-(3-hydroxymyristoyl)glucosamine N-acyltransferase [Puniceicoccales bacterium]